MNFPWETNPQTPSRTTSHPPIHPTTNTPSHLANQPKTENTWRQAIGTILAILIGISVIFSLFVLLLYVSRDGELYEELTDYLDKTVSISKINYNPSLGNYETRQDELDILADQRKYKSLMYMFLFADAASLFFVTVSILLYYTSDLRKGNLSITFWLFLVVGALYAVIESSAFCTLIYPYSAKLPNSTEILLDRSVPYNPGGLIQMETKLGCTFNQNLYNTFQRKQNPRNTCDPQILNSFISNGMIISFVVMRLVVILISVVLLVVKPIGRPLGRVFALTRPKDGYKAKYIKNAKAKKGSKNFNYDTAKSTTFDASEKRPPIISSPIDHTLSYNNAAYFAVANATPNAMHHNGSSRSSEISRCDAADLYNQNRVNGSVHTQHSLISEV